MARVLVVEDDPSIRQLVLTQLRLAGHRVAGADSGREALELVEEKGPPDIAVLDVAMPEMTGIELLQELRGREGMAELPAIFLSARVQPKDIAAGEALGAIYLTKPFVTSALLGAVERSLAPSEAGDDW